MEDQAQHHEGAEDQQQVNHKVAQHVVIENLGKAAAVKATATKKPHGGFAGGRPVTKKVTNFLPAAVKIELQWPQVSPPHQQQSRRQKNKISQPNAGRRRNLV